MKNREQQLLQMGFKFNGHQLQYELSKYGYIYELFPLESDLYYFIDDGVKPIYYFFEKYFVTIEQWRNDKLKELGVE